MPATMKDISKKTGLAMATISKYLNGGNVLPENKILIDQAVEELQYEINEMARGLSKNQTKIVGVMVYDISSYFSSNVLHYIGVELRKHGYGMMICDSANDEELEKENLRFLVNRKVDGLLVIPVSVSGEFLKPAKQEKVPIVLLDRMVRDEDYDSVSIDNRAAAIRATNTMIQNHHEKIAIIGAKEADTGAERYKGYCEAMREAGLSIREEYIKLKTFSIEDGFQSMKELMALEEPPTAVFLSNYEVALGGIMALNEAKWSCPEDVSLFAMDDLLFTKVMQPNLWLTTQPIKELCENAVRLLLGRMNHENEGSPVRLCFGVSVREGTSIRDLA